MSPTRTTSFEKRVSFAVKLEESREPENMLEIEQDESSVLSPKNSNVPEDDMCDVNGSDAQNTAIVPVSLSQIRKDIEFVPKNSSASQVQRGERGPWSMGCFIDTLCVAPGEKGAEISLASPKKSSDKENVDAPGQKFNQPYSPSNSDIVEEEPTEYEELSDDAFLPVSEDAFAPPEEDEAFFPPESEEAYFPDSDEAFLPQDESAFLPTQINAALFDATIDSQNHSFLEQEAQEVQLVSAEFNYDDPSHAQEAHLDTVPAIGADGNIMVNFAPANESQENETGVQHDELQMPEPSEEVSATTSDQTNSRNQDNSIQMSINNDLESTATNIPRNENADVQTLIDDQKLAVGEPADATKPTQRASAPVHEAEIQTTGSTSISLMHTISQDETIQELRIQLQQSEEEKRKAVSDAVREIESRLKEDSMREVVKVAQSARIARCVELSSRDKEKKKLEQEKKEQVMQIAGAMKVATAIRNEFAEEEGFGELKTLKQSLGNLLKNQKATIESLQTSVVDKNKSIAALKQKCTDTEDQLRATQSSLRVAEKALITMKGELSGTRKKLRDAEQELGDSKSTLENHKERIANMTAELEAAAKDREVMATLQVSLNYRKHPNEFQTVNTNDLRDQLRLSVELLHKENKEMRALTNHQSDVIVKNERAIAELNDRVTYLKSQEETATRLGEENSAMQARIGQIECEVRDLLESVKLADIQKVELKTEHQQQIQTLNEQLRTLSLDCQSLRTILSSKSKISGCNGSSEDQSDTEEIPLSEHQNHFKNHPKSQQSISREKDKEEAPFGKQNSAACDSGTKIIDEEEVEEVDPIFSCSEGAFHRRVDSDDSGVCSETYMNVSQKKDNDARGEPIQPIFSIASEENNSEDDGDARLLPDEGGNKETVIEALKTAKRTKKIWSLSCGCYAPSPSASFHGDLPQLKARNGRENQYTRTIAVEADNELQDAEDETPSPNGGNKTGANIIPGIVLEGDEDSELNQIEAILNTFSSIVSDISIQKSSSASSDILSNGSGSFSGESEIDSQVNEDERDDGNGDRPAIENNNNASNSDCETGNSLGTKRTPSAAEAEDTELTRKLESLSGQLFSILSDPKPKTTSSRGDDLFGEKVGVLKAAFKTLQFEKERIFKEAEEEKKKAIAEMRTQLDEEKQAFIAAQEQRFEEIVGSPAVAKFEEDLQRHFVGQSIREDQDSPHGGVIQQDVSAKQASTRQEEVVNKTTQEDQPSSLNDNGTSTNASKKVPSKIESLSPLPHQQQQSQSASAPVELSSALVPQQKSRPSLRIATASDTTLSNQPTKTTRSVPSYLKSAKAKTEVGKPRNSTTRASTANNRSGGARRSSIKPPTPTSRLTAPQTSSKRTQVKRIGAAVPNPRAPPKPSRVKAARGTLALAKTIAGSSRQHPPSRLPRPSISTPRASMLNQTQGKPQRGSNTLEKQAPTGNKAPRNPTSKQTSQPTRSSRVDNARAQSTKGVLNSKKNVDDSETMLKCSAKRKDSISTKNLEDSFASLLRTRDTISTPRAERQPDTAATFGEFDDGRNDKNTMAQADSEAREEINCDISTTIVNEASVDGNAVCTTSKSSNCGDLHDQSATNYNFAIDPSGTKQVEDDFVEDSSPSQAILCDGIDESIPASTADDSSADKSVDCHGAPVITQRETVISENVTAPLETNAAGQAICGDEEDKGIKTVGSPADIELFVASYERDNVLKDKDEVVLDDGIECPKPSTAALSRQMGRKQSEIELEDKVGGFASNTKCTITVEGDKIPSSKLESISKDLAPEIPELQLLNAEISTSDCDLEDDSVHSLDAGQIIMTLNDADNYGDNRATGQKLEKESVGLGQTNGVDRPNNEAPFQLKWSFQQKTE